MSPQADWRTVDFTRVSLATCGAPLKDGQESVLFRRLVAGAGASARGWFEITTLVKSGTEHVGPGEWTYSSKPKVRHRSERGVGESARSLTMTASWRAAGYALGRLLVAS
jgi:hypothetical protein